MREEKKLDRVLRGKGAPDASTAALVAVASELKQLAHPTVPVPGHARSMFVSVVQGRRRRGIAPFLAPVAAGIVLVFALGFTAGNALPGDRIYVVRKAMAAVGLVSSPAEQATASLDSAAARLTVAEQLLEGSPGRARGLAFTAIARIEAARRLLEDVSPQVQGGLEAQIDSLTERAAAVIAISVGSEEGAQNTSGDDGQEGRGEDDGDEPGGEDRENGVEDDQEGAGEDDNSGPIGDDESSDDTDSGDTDSGDDNSVNDSDETDRDSGDGDSSSTGSNDDESSDGGGD